MLITTRSKGFPYHAYPHDHWRYEIEDMNEIFADCEIMDLQKDPQVPGVFLKARKPKSFIEKDLSRHQLYSILKNKITSQTYRKIPMHFKLRHLAKILLGRIDRIFSTFLREQK